MRAQITHAQSMADYIHGVLQNRYDLSLPENKARAVAELKELTAKLPKGSSFRWWLNNDFWARLSGKNHNKPLGTPPTTTKRRTVALSCICAYSTPPTSSKTTP